MLFDPIQSGHLGVGSDEIGSNMRTNTIDRRRSLPRRTIPLTFDFSNSHISPTEWLTLLCFLPFIIGFASAKHFPLEFIFYLWKLCDSLSLSVSLLLHNIEFSLLTRIHQIFSVCETNYLRTKDMFKIQSSRFCDPWSLITRHCVFQLCFYEDPKKIKFANLTINRYCCLSVCHHRCDQNTVAKFRDRDKRGNLRVPGESILVWTRAV